MMISDGNIYVKCHTCGIKRPECEWTIDVVHRWSNQFGSGYRFFCHNCGSVHDVDEASGNVKIRLLAQKCAIWKR